MLTACHAAPRTAPAPSPTTSPAPSPTPALATGDVRFTRGSSALLHLRVQIAETEAERDAGLMNVDQLPAGTGMAFVFGGDTDTSFYMKDTRIPLDIAFMDGTGAVVTTYTMTPCTADPCHLYQAQDTYRTAVEMNAGVLNAAGVRLGDTGSLTR